MYAYGVLKGLGSGLGQNDNPMWLGNVACGAGKDTTIFELIGSGLVTQISYVSHFISLRLCVQIDNGNVQIINNGGCVHGMGLVGTSCNSVIYCPWWKDGDNHAITCRIPFKFDTNFKFIIQNPDGRRDSSIIGPHLYYLVKYDD